MMRAYTRGREHKETGTLKKGLEKNPIIEHEENYCVSFFYYGN